MQCDQCGDTRGHLARWGCWGRSLRRGNGAEPEEHARHTGLQGLGNVIQGGGCAGKGPGWGASVEPELKAAWWAHSRETEAPVVEGWWPHLVPQCDLDSEAVGSLGVSGQRPGQICACGDRSAWGSAYREGGGD